MNEPAPATRPGGPPAPARRRRRLVRMVVLAVLAVVGLAGAGGGGAALARELTRHATVAEQAAAGRAEAASRWQRLPAGKIFPASYRYTTQDEGVSMTATRVAIGTGTSCAAALDPALESVLRTYGCVTVLRATYVDASGTLALTAGVVVMRSPAAAGQAVSSSAGVPANAGVRTMSLPGTVANQFGDPQRRDFASIDSTGRYIVLYAAGYTDGRVSGSGSTTPEFDDFGQGALGVLQAELTATGRPCSLLDVRC